VYVKHVIVIVSAFALDLPGTATPFLLEEKVSEHGQNWSFGDEDLFSFAFCCTSMVFFQEQSAPNSSVAPGMEGHCKSCNAKAAWCNNLPVTLKAGCHVLT